MKIWIFTTKEPLEYMKLDEDEEIKRSSTDKAKKGDVILIYRGKPYSNIQYIFKAKNDAYQDKTFRDDWETAIDLEEKIELKNPLTISEMKDDPVLSQFGVVRKNFIGSFFEVPLKEWERLQTLIKEKNEGLDLVNPPSSVAKWTFVMKEYFFDELKKRNVISWNSPKDIKKDDLVFVYSTSPRKHVDYILKATSDPFEDPASGELSVMVQKMVEIPNPVELQEIKDNPILSKWAPINKKGFIFQGAHHKMSEQQYNELKNLILKKNPGIDIDGSKKIDIREFLFKVLRGYKGVKDREEPVAGNKFSTLFRDFSSNLQDFANQYVSEDRYESHPVYHAGGTWVKQPYVWSEDKVLKSESQYDNPFVYLNYSFKEDMQGVYLKLFLSSEYAEQYLSDNKSEFKDILDYRTSRVTELRNKLSEEHLDLDGLFEPSNQPGSSIIVSRYYNKNDLPPNEELMDDLKNFLDIYKILSTFEVLSPGSFDKVGFGRAHIVRDICYLIDQNQNIDDEALFDLLREKVGDNDDYWKAYYQKAKKHNSPKINLDSARNLNLVKEDKLELTALGKKLVKNVTNTELYTHYYSLDIKKFFFSLAVKNPAIKTAMQILKEREMLRFFSPICDLTHKVVWNYVEKGNKFICKENKHPECKDCDKDLLSHIKETSLPFETDKKVNNGGGYVFWMCSRVTPMHLTGQDPGYSGNSIYWDKEAADELGDLIDLINDKVKTIHSHRIWKITPGDPERSQIYWPQFKDGGYIGIGWIEMKNDFREYRSLDELKTAMEKEYGQPKIQAAKMVWDFSNVIQEGDYVVANRGYKKALGLGIITSEYISADDPENPNFGEDYPHLHKVDWKIVDDIEMTDNFFDRKTVTELDGYKWNDLISAYAKKNPEFRYQLLEELYNEFKTTYLDTEAGQEHLKAYFDESKKTSNKYRDIQEKRAQNIDATDDILYGMVPHRYKSLVGFVVDIKAFLEKTLEIKPENFPKIADKLFRTIEDLIENDEDPLIQAEILENFVNSEYSKGFGAGTLTPTLFFIDHKYPFINNKTVDTVLFLSKIIGEPIKIDRDLNNYIDNKAKLENFIVDLSSSITDISDFAIFDIFCHWMCDKDLGFYAKGRPLSLLDIEEPPEEFEPVFIMPSEIETKLVISPKIFEQVCGTLNSGKQIMLTGAPGTGKTNLALDVCKVAVDQNFTDGYVLTTATSDWTTFDTIGGYMPDESTQLIFKEGKFLQSISENKWLIIDEINRSDIDKAFGQLFTVLSGQEVELPFKIDGNSVRIVPSDEIRSYYDPDTATYNVGKNWRIIATMNVYDKDYLFEMSYAFMRRFTFIYIDLPAEEEYKNLIQSWCDSLNEDYIKQIYQLLQINPYREIGPAIFKDVIEYVAARERIGSTDHILEDAVLSYIMPQFEGLEKTQILEIWDILKNTFDESTELKARLEEISTVKLE